MWIVASRAVALGGGHGLAVALEALRTVADDVTAIVTIADDGGSSGVLRALTGIAPPGDARRCLGALTDPNSQWPKLLEHRFAGGPFAGHPVGNVILAALEEQTNDPERAFAIAGELFGIFGRVLPASCVPVSLRARTATREVVGQIAIATCGERIEQLDTVETNPRSPRAAIEAITDADMVVIGPGSLYTSLLPVLVLPEINAALIATTARIVFVANLGEDRETRGMSGAEHLGALTSHGVRVDHVILASDGDLDLDSSHVTIQRSPLRSGASHDVDALACALSALPL